MRGVFIRVSAIHSFGNKLVAAVVQFGGIETAEPVFVIRGSSRNGVQSESACRSVEEFECQTC